MEERNAMSIASIGGQRLAEHGPYLGKWLWRLFWLVIPTFLGNAMVQESVTELIPVLRIPGEVLSTLCSIAYGFILLKLAAVERRYRIAGWYCIVVAVGNIGMTFLNLEGRIWLIVPLLLWLVVALVAEYQEYAAHAEILSGVDDALSEKWRSLWKWYLGLLLGLFGCILLMIPMPIFGALLLLADAIGLAVVSILKLVYLYRSAKLFRDSGVERIGIEDEASL